MSKKYNKTNKNDTFENNYELMCHVAKEHGGECLSHFDDYVNTSSKLNFKCKKGHRFTKTYDNMQWKETWCHSCKVGKRSISDMKDIAAKYDGECLSTEYKNLITPLQWKCKKGHVFTRKAQYIYNGKGFCMKCKKC